MDSGSLTMPFLSLPWRITLPYPPSGYQLWDQNPKTRRKYRTRQYEDWIVQADESALFCMPLPRFVGKLAVEATVYPGKGFRTSGDGDNRLKAPVDWLVSRGVIPGDSWKVITDWRIKLARCRVKTPTMITIEIRRADDGTTFKV